VKRHGNISVRCRELWPADSLRSSNAREPPFRWPAV